MYKFTVEEIKFNHDKNSCTSDAVGLRKNLREEYDTSLGEWWTGGSTLKNDPVCYAGGVTPTVKVRFKVSPDIASARLSARPVGADSPLGGLKWRDVDFPFGERLGVVFAVDTRIPRTVRKADHRWEWRVSKIDGRDVAAFTCATTGPHRVYTVLDVPKEPWKPNGIIQAPWVDALELACTVAEGKSGKVQALAAITSNLFQNMGFVYDVQKGDSQYCEALDPDGTMFSLDGYLKVTSPKVNCSDQAFGLATLGNLLGIKSTVVTTQPIGYINTVNLVGVGPCNNPGYLGLDAPCNVAVCDPDDTSRSNFKYHRYVLAEGVVFDACVGPALGTQTRLEYLRSVIDTSTEAEWSESLFSPLGNPAIPFKMKYESRNYWLIGVK